MFMALLASGCAPVISGVMSADETEATAKQKTAVYFGVPESQIRLENYEDGMLAKTYRAYYQNTMYNCRLYYDEVTCARPGESPM
jgi:hypothetical protein